MLLGVFDKWTKRLFLGKEAAEEEEQETAPPT